MSDFAIDIKNLRKSYKNTEVLKGVNLQVERGTIFALLGPNGAGKTTTVRILSTLLEPDSGEATVNGFNVVSDAQKVRENIGLTGQYAAVDGYLNAYENLVMFGRLYHMNREKSETRAKELLEKFDLVEASKRPVKTFSGGMMRRLDLAASLMATPPVIFLDEPTTGLDPRSRISMWEVIEKLVETNITVLLTTQYLEEADYLADRIAVLDDGRIIAEGTADELKAKVGSDRLELVFEKVEELKKAESALNLQGTVVDERNKTLSIPMESGVGGIKKVLDEMERAGVHIESLSLHKPTLDDVFLKLTGHKAEKEVSEEEKK